jgi:hypothetical protein
MKQVANVPDDRPRRAKTGLYVRSTNGLRLRDEKVRRLVRRMRQCMPWLEDADEPAARAWAQIEVLADMAHTILRTIGITSHGGEPRRLLTDFRQLRLAQLQYARELGMTPAARLAIQVSGEGKAFDLAEQVTGAAIEISEARSTPSGPTTPIHDEDSDENRTH